MDTTAKRAPRPDRSDAIWQWPRGAEPRTSLSNKSERAFSPANQEITFTVHRRRPPAKGLLLHRLAKQPLEVFVQLTSCEETLKYRFLPISETDASEAFEILSLNPKDGHVRTEIVHEQPLVSKTLRREKNRIAFGFLFQLAGNSQLTLDQVQVSSDDPIHINQISVRKVAVYRYSGAWSELRYKRMLKNFLFELRKIRVETTGEPVYSRRDRANRFWARRRNEIWLEVAR